jgi:hypothetical protein
VLITSVTASGSAVNVFTYDSATYTGLVRGHLLDPNGATGNTINNLSGADTTGFVADISIN